MASKDSIEKKLRVAYPSESPFQALKAILESFDNPQAALPMTKLDLLVDVVVSKGSADQAMDAFAAIPAEEEYTLTRMSCLRRLWSLGTSFLTNEGYRMRFDRLRLLPGEYERMAREFGHEATARFLSPQAFVPRSQPSRPQLAH